MLAALWGCTVMLPSYFIWEKQWRFGLMKSQRIIKVGRIHHSHGNHECLHQISQRSIRHLLKYFSLDQSHGPHDLTLPSLELWMYFYCSTVTFSIVEAPKEPREAPRVQSTPQTYVVYYFWLLMFILLLLEPLGHWYTLCTKLCSLTNLEHYVCIYVSAWLLPGTHNIC